MILRERCPWCGSSQFVQLDADTQTHAVTCMAGHFTAYVSDKGQVVKTVPPIQGRPRPEPEEGIRSWLTVR